MKTRDYGKCAPQKMADGGIIDGFKGLFSRISEGNKDQPGSVAYNKYGEGAQGRIDSQNDTAGAEDAYAGIGANSSTKPFDASADAKEGRGSPGGVSSPEPWSESGPGEGPSSSQEQGAVDRIIKATSSGSSKQDGYRKSAVNPAPVIKTVISPVKAPKASSAPPTVVAQPDVSSPQIKSTTGPSYAGPSSESDTPSQFRRGQIGIQQSFSPKRGAGSPGMPITSAMRARALDEGRSAYANGGYIQDTGRSNYSKKGRP